MEIDGSKCTENRCDNKGMSTIISIKQKITTTTTTKELQLKIGGKLSLNLFPLKIKLLNAGLNITETRELKTNMHVC